MPRDAKILRIVVASASDVQAERDLVQVVADEVNYGAAGERNLVLQVSRWEKDAFPSFHAGGPQGLIDSILHIAECDIFVGIFWKRFGTPVTDARSGTEHEYRQAFEMWRQKGTPQIFFYFNQKLSNPKSKEETDQWGMVLEFRANFPKEGLWWPYQGKSDFKELLRRHLESFIRKQFPLPANGASAGELALLLKKQQEEQAAFFRATRQRMDELEYLLRQATAPGPLTRQALALQKQQKELNAFIEEWMRSIVDHPAEAYQRLGEAFAMAETFHRAERDFLNQMGPSGAEQIPRANWDANELKAQLLIGRGQSALMLNAIDNARLAYEEVRQMVPQQHHLRAFADAGLAQVSRSG